MQMTAFNAQRLPGHPVSDQGLYHLQKHRPGPPNDQHLTAKGDICSDSVPAAQLQKLRAVTALGQGTDPKAKWHKPGCSGTPHVLFVLRLRP